MPRGLLRALDPVLAVALGPARDARPEFRASFEAALRGKPDGPLLLALWEAAAAGEVPHADLRRLVALMEEPMPQDPPTRGDLLAWLHPRASAAARVGLTLAQRLEPESLAPAERLACGFVLTRLLVDFPHHAAAGRNYLPLSDLARAGLTREALLDGVRTAPLHALLELEAEWAAEMLTQGLPVCERVGARLRRGLRAAVLRSRLLLAQARDRRRDPFRNPPHLSHPARWRCAVRAWRPLRLEPTGPPAAPR